MKFLQKYVTSRRPDAKLAYWAFAWRRDASPLLDELGAMIDHIHAVSVGGGGEETNLVTACAKCNMTKSNTEKADFLKKHPPRRIRGKYGEPTQWDGFSTLFVLLFEEYRSTAMGSERAWYKALTGEQQPS
jgi:5-methylcytosine-specific restriction endonuclease McrA